MIIWPVVRFLAGGELRSMWLGTREALSIELGEAAIRHALEEARLAKGTDIRIEFIADGPQGATLLRVRVPAEHSRQLKGSGHG